MQKRQEINQFCFIWKSAHLRSCPEHFRDIPRISVGDYNEIARGRLQRRSFAIIRSCFIRVRLIKYLILKYTTKFKRLSYHI
jgi:hypothetical protein